MVTKEIKVGNTTEIPARMQELRKRVVIGYLMEEVNNQRSLSEKLMKDLEGLTQEDLQGIQYLEVIPLTEAAVEESFKRYVTYTVCGWIENGTVTFAEGTVLMDILRQMMDCTIPTVPYLETV